MRVNPTLSKLGDNPMAELYERARAIRAGGGTLIDFSIGDPREPTPEFVRREVAAPITEVSQYPVTAGLPELRKKVASHVRRRFGVEADPDTRILATTGSKEAIFSTALARVDPRAGSFVVWGTRALLDGGVVVAPGSSFRPGGEGYLRLALVPTVDECEAARKVIVQCLT